MSSDLGDFKYYQQCFFHKLDKYKDSIKKDIARLVAVRSVYDDKSICDFAPFGRGVRTAFDIVLDIAQKAGLHAKDFDGYALHIEYGEGDEILGILGHLDIVPEGDLSKWNFNPFILTERDGFLYGRGVNDDKAPVIGCIYILRILKEIGYRPNKKIRLILGGAEETSWECMKHYLKMNPHPDIAFSPDCNFPVVNCEKGILKYEYRFYQDEEVEGIHSLLEVKSNKSLDFGCCNIQVSIKTAKPYLLLEKLDRHSHVRVYGSTIEIVYEGELTLSRNPQRGQNAVFKFVQDFRQIEGMDSFGEKIIRFIDTYFLDSVYGEKLGIGFEDLETGRLTDCLCYVVYDGKQCQMGFDIRYPNGIEKQTIIDKLSRIACENSVELSVIKEMDRLYVSPDSVLVNELCMAYQMETGKMALPVTKGGASYSRAVRNCVGFGPTFLSENPNSHKENECIESSSFFKALSIYFNAIWRLASG